MGPSRCSAVFLLTLLISPIDCLPQSKSTENSSGSARGRVLFGSENHPIHHAPVEFTLPSTGWTGVLFTDGNGHFELQGLSPGTYHLKVTAPGFEKLVGTAQVAGRTGPTDLHLRKARATPAVRSDHVVSVQELRISGEGSKEYDKGTRLLVRGNTMESVPFLTRAILENPEHYRAYYNLGVAQFRVGHLADAEQAFQREANLAGAYFLFARIHQRPSDVPAAAKDLNAYLELDPNGAGSAEARAFLESTKRATDQKTDAAMVAKANP